MKEQILALEPSDDLSSLRDKIARAQARRLVLIWGALAEPLSRRLDLVLMKRWSSMAGSELAIVSEDEAVQRLAHAAGVPCHPSLKASALAALSPRPEAPERSFASRRKRRHKAGIPRKARSREIPRPLRIGLFTAAVLSISAVLLLLLPSARVQAVFPSRMVETSEILDSAFCTRMKTRLTLSERRATTGKVLAPTAFATGTVVLTNVSNRALNLGAGLRVSSQSGILYETADGFALAPGMSQPVPVRALEPGSASNLAAGMVNRVLGPLALSLEAENPEPMTGGEESWRNAVSASDWKALQTFLTERIRREAEESLRALAGENRFVVEESLQVEFDPLDEPDLPVHSPADTVGLTRHAEASLLACPAGWVRIRAAEALKPLLLPGETLVLDDLTIRLLDNAQGEIELAASASALDVPDRNEMALALRLCTPEQAASLLMDRFRAGEDPRIDLDPPWFPWLPLFPYQIEFTTEAR